VDLDLTLHGTTGRDAILPEGDGADDA